MNWILITVGAIIITGMIIGICKGAVKIAVSLAALVVTLVLVFFLTPYVGKGLASITPLDDMVENKVMNTITGTVTSGDAGESGLTEESVRNALKAVGISEDQLAAAGITVEDIVNGKITGEDLEEYGISGKILDGLKSDTEDLEEKLKDAEIPRELQIAAIENADIPQVFKELLLTNNNNEIYESLGAETFVEYVAKYLAKLVVNIVAFLLTFVIVTIILKAIIYALDIVAKLPVLGLINRVAGAFVGAGIALIIIWICFIGITLLYTAGIGKDWYTIIRQDEILNFLYENNVIMNLATTIR